MDDHGWYDPIVGGEELRQGDILEKCPVFIPPDTFDLTSIQDGQEGIEFLVAFPTVVILSQSCDMVSGREKIQQVILCRLMSFEDFSPGDYAVSNKGKEEIRRGNSPSSHMLHQCKLEDFQRDIRVVDFKQVFCVPISLIRNFASSTSKRIRLREPFREHLSQAFGRFFMRVALPSDIPAFPSK